MLNCIIVSYCLYPFQHLFSIIRGRGGFNSHPTAKQTAGAIKAICGNSFLMKTCYVDSKINDEYNYANIDNTKSEEGTITAEDDYECVEHTITNFNDEDGLTDNNTLSYILGSLIQKMNCPTCTHAISDNKNRKTVNNFTKMMEYEGAKLHSPKEETIKIFKNILQPATTFFKNNLHLKDITLLGLGNFRIPSPTLGCCTQEHCDYMIRLFLKLLLCVICKNINTKIKNSKHESKKRKFNMFED